MGEVDVTNETIARAGGRLLGDAGSDATIDAIVVATAAEAGGSVVLTSDPVDLNALASRDPRVVIQPL